LPGGTDGRGRGVRSGPVYREVAHVWLRAPNSG
jgi:hypothetical protein